MCYLTLLITVNGAHPIRDTAEIIFTFKMWAIAV